MEQNFGGVYLGLVHDNKDPLNNRRLKVRVPQLFGSSNTDWAPAMLNNTTDYEVPKVNQTVWVMFQGGNPSFPVWSAVHAVPGQESKKVIIKTPTTSQLTEEFIVSSTAINRTELDLVATLVAMSQEIEDLGARVTSLETRMTAEENKPDLT